jgi:hypothetical protein
MDTKQLQASKIIHAPSEKIFALLEDPHRHTALDGSGTLRGPDTGTSPLSAIGQVFIMNMSAPDLGDYRAINTVTALVPGTRIGWGPSLDPSCALAEKLGDMKTGGHTFTYDLLEVEGGTEVTQTYDWSGVKDPKFEAICPRVSQDDLARTLDNIASAIE